MIQLNWLKQKANGKIIRFIYFLEYYGWFRVAYVLYTVYTIHTPIQSDHGNNLGFRTMANYVIKLIKFDS